MTVGRIDRAAGGRRAARIGGGAAAGLRRSAARRDSARTSSAPAARSIPSLGGGTFARAGRQFDAALGPPQRLVRGLPQLDSGGPTARDRGRELDGRLQGPVFREGSRAERVRSERRALAGTGVGSALTPGATPDPFTREDARRDRLGARRVTRGNRDRARRRRGG